VTSNKFLGAQVSRPSLPSKINPFTMYWEISLEYESALSTQQQILLRLSPLKRGFLFRRKAVFSTLS
jgi:hypothetical protein